MTPQGVAKWRKEKRTIIALIEKYFTKEDLVEFKETNKIKKFDNLLIIQSKVFNYNANKYINTFLQNTLSNTLKFTNPAFFDFYFSFLVKFNQIEEDSKEELLSVKRSSFQALINNFFIDYIFADKNQDVYKYKIIGSYIYIFNEWDELMSVFLSQAVDNDFSNLLDADDIYTNQLKREEAYLHIIGLYVYRNHSSLKLTLKYELIKHLTESVKDKFFDYKTLFDFMNEKVEENIQVLKELGFDR